MTTKNIVPRADLEGSLGTAAKRWGAVHTQTLNADVIPTPTYNSIDADYTVGAEVMYGGQKYVCIQSNGASSTVVAPTDTSYWTPVAANYVYNTRDLITSSGNYTAPVTGWYKVTLKGGGGGGSGAIGNKTSLTVMSGWGGGEGGSSLVYAYLSSGDIIPVIIGAGGSGGAIYSSATGAGNTATAGGKGGTSSVTINGITTQATGGGRADGTGAIIGLPSTIVGGVGNYRNGLNGNTVYGYKSPNIFGTSCLGANGGGETNNANDGHGGRGGVAGFTAGDGDILLRSGDAGAPGFVSFEYFDPNKEA